MRIIDTHCHPQFSQYNPDRDSVIKHALDAGISMICVGTDLELSRQAVALTEKYENPPSPDSFGRASIWATVGSHPNEIHQVKSLSSQSDELYEFEKLATHRRVAAIGEIGLDYFHTKDLEKRNVQKKVFQDFIELALEMRKPIIIHSRDAFGDTLDILREASQKRLSGVVHSFTGTPKEAHSYIELGFFIGLNGIITFSDSYNDLVDNLPLKYVLCETDAPFLAPAPYRGQRNEPAHVIDIARHIAMIKNVSFEEVCKITAQNAVSLFKL